MRALVTGATGFIGSHVVRCLLTRNDDVAVLVRPTSDLWRIADVTPRLAVIETEPRRVVTAAPRVADFMPATVVNLPWASVHGQQRDDPAHLETNFRYTFAVVELGVA